MSNGDSTRSLVDKSWDPIIRIIGSLGVHTKIDFANNQVAECRTTSSIFRGYSVFMRGKDPRDAHFITSRICGICGDNHATCVVYAQNMAFGVRPPAIAEWIINCGEAAEYMFDHNLFQDNPVGVDFCERMVRETNPSVLARAEHTAAPHAEWSAFGVPDQAIGCGFHEAVRGGLSHHVVIREGKIANYHPYPPTAWNASPRDSFGTPGPHEDAIQNTPLFEENRPDAFKGIDTMRTIRSFDPCLPCGVHMYLGDGRVLEVRHSPTFGALLSGGADVRA